jgi:hypothetical protein
VNLKAVRLLMKITDGIGFLTVIDALKNNICYRPANRGWVKHHSGSSLHTRRTISPLIFNGATI